MNETALFVPGVAFPEVRYQSGNNSRSAIAATRILLGGREPCNKAASAWYRRDSDM
jgi:hypothetical protein